MPSTYMFSRGNRRCAGHSKEDDEHGFQKIVDMDSHIRGYTGVKRERESARAQEGTIMKKKIPLGFRIRAG